MQHQGMAVSRGEGERESPRGRPSIATHLEGRTQTPIVTIETEEEDGV